MKFDLKKDWVKLVVGLVSLFMVVYLLITLLAAPSGAPFAEMVAPQIAKLIFFLGMVAIVVLKIVDQKKIAGIVLLATGLLVTVLFAIHFFDGIGAATDMISAGRDVPGDMGAGMVAGGRLAIISMLSMLFVFGLFPLLKGCKKVLCSGCDKKD